MNNKLFLAIFILTGCISVSVSAGPTGLIIIPTADILETGVYEIEYELDGHSPFPVGADISLLNTQFGIAKRLEAGVDFRLWGDMEADVLFNAKYGFPVHTVSGAVGIYDVGSQSISLPYVVFSKYFGTAEFSAGAQLYNDDIQPLLGMSYEIGRLILQADYISGRENFSSLGFEYALSDLFTLQWSWQVSHKGDIDDAYTLHLIFSSWFR